MTLSRQAARPQPTWCPDWIWPLLREADLAHLAWATREIDPMHADLPAIVIRRAELEADRHRAIAMS